MSTTTPARLETSANDPSGTDPIDQLQFSQKTGKRAVYEEFEYSPGAGYVDVTNASHGEEAATEHSYRVDVDGGVPTGCECPAKEYHCDAGEACKHMVAVALAQPVCEVATDGGIIVGDDGTELVDDDSADDVDEEGVCPNGETICPVDNPEADDDSLVCFDCYLERDN